jgi:hypothetical protein
MFCIAAYFLEILCFNALLDLQYLKTFSTSCEIIKKIKQESKTTDKTPSKRHLRLVGSTLSVNSYNLIIKLGRISL